MKVRDWKVSEGEGDFVLEEHFRCMMITHMHFSLFYFLIIGTKKNVKVNHAHVSIIHGVWTSYWSLWFDGLFPLKFIVRFEICLSNHLIF
jgi:hypothetical protein